MSLPVSSYEYLLLCPPPSLGDPIAFNLAPADLRAAQGLIVGRGNVDDES